MKHKFVENIPGDVDDGIIYVSIQHGTAVHKCCCGCGSEIVTPLSPTDWKLIYDGEAVSLYPSVGNWNLKCRSHYWIKENEVVWAESWTEEDVEQIRRYEIQVKEAYYSQKRGDSVHYRGKTVEKISLDDKRTSEFWLAIRKWWTPDGTK